MGRMLTLFRLLRFTAFAAIDLLYSADCYFSRVTRLPWPQEDTNAAVSTHATRFGSRA